MKRTLTKGFTLIELLVVIAVIALLMAVVMPSLGQAKRYAQRIICSNHLRQQGLAAMLYGNENDTYVPCPQPYTSSGTGAVMGGGWFWDISFWFTNQLCDYAGFEKTDSSVFTCPSNRMRKPDDALWWQYSWSANGPSPQPLKDESTLTMAQQRAHFRVAPYLYFFDRYVYDVDHRSLYDPACTISVPFPSTTADGRPMEDRVIRKLSNLKSGGSMPMIADAIISENNHWKFAGLTAGGIDAKSAGTLTDDTNHLSRRTIGTGAAQGPKPEGMNIVFADGHTEWRAAGNFDTATNQFENIKVQYRYGQWFWW
jgi:prepilin-type N-terminal cleavage/methylation domain-containing protein/prepilin-type processing-associated H-X9-DG protein